MDIDAFLCDSNQTKIKIIAGDLAGGIWDLNGSLLLHTQRSGSAASESINVADSVRRLDVKDLLNKDSFEPLLGLGLGALLGFRMFGPLGAAGGAIAGHLFTRNRLEVSVTCELTDGRKFIAVMHPTTYQRLQKVASRGNRSVGD